MRRPCFALIRLRAVPPSLLQHLFGIYTPEAQPIIMGTSNGSEEELRSTLGAMGLWRSVWAAVGPCSLLPGGGADAAAARRAGQGARCQAWGWGMQPADGWGAGSSTGCSPHLVPASIHNWRCSVPHLQAA